MDGLAEILSGVPGYDRFPAPADLSVAFADLAEEFPGRVRSESIGTSAEGRPIELITVGHGSTPVLLVGVPHPNEAVGTLTGLFLARLLCEDPDVAERLDVTLHVVPIADPDGYSLNSGWLDEPISFVSYAAGFYRPPHHEQVEWSYPVLHRTLRFSTPAPETQAIMRVMERVRPNLFYSLHNSGLGGVYFYASDDKPTVFERWSALPETLGLTLHRGEPEVPYLEAFAPSIYRMFGVADTYEFFRRTLGIDPAPLIGAGTSGDDWLRRVHPSAFSIVCEVPYFSIPGIGDEEPSELSRREAMEQGLGRAQEILGKIDAAVGALRQDLDRSRIGRSLRAYLEKTPQRLAAHRKHLGASAFDRPATRAEAVDAIWGPAFYHTMYVGEAYRVALEAGEVGVADDLYREIERMDVILRVDALVRPMPLQQLVRCQAGAALIALAT